MRIERNSIILELDTLKEKIKELKTELYFCNRNNKLENIVESS